MTEYGYPETVIDRKFHDTKLPGPAPKPKDLDNAIPLPFVSTYYNNYNCNNITHTANTLLVGQTHKTRVGGGMK